MESAEQRMQELQEIIDEDGITGDVSFSTACQFMHSYLDIGDESVVRQPEILLKRLRLTKGR